MSNTSVVSVKVPADLMQEIRRSKDEIDWPEEIREFIRDRALRWETDRRLAALDRKHAHLPQVRRGLAAALVREDRDSR